jgi:Domain of unknown function (DUF397)
VDGNAAAELVWHRGAQCDIGNCLEVAAVDESVLLRSTTNPAGAHLAISRHEWAEFLLAAKAGDFDGVSPATG